MDTPEGIDASAAGDPDGVHLGEPTGSAVPYRRLPRNSLSFICLGARHLSVRTVLPQNFPDARSGGKMRRIAGAGKGGVPNPAQRLRSPPRLRT
jgi:hypothetical protein